MRDDRARDLLDNADRVSPEQALEYHIATAITADASGSYTQDAKKQIFRRIFAQNAKPQEPKKNNILKLFERG